MHYKIQFLRSFHNDFDDIIDYIARRLGAPNAASKLAEDLLKAIDRIADFPYSCKLYLPSRPLSLEYRMFTVGNYAVLYAVDETDKTIRFYRMLYGRRDFERLL